MNDDNLRLDVKLLKACNNIRYKTISLELGIKQNSFYGWLKGDFNLSDANKRKLITIISKYKE